MEKIFSDDAWNDFLYWQEHDKNTYKRILSILKDIERNGNSGIGKPELLRADLAGFWSRRIDQKNRIVYRIDNNQLYIIQCGSHYRDK
ncbi:MAG: Txe/YoeB family addiction module toxin [Clostridia bacterium]|nr:Txe/YoeB family addiction module toxin [Clostridia bacterium]